MDKNKNYKKDLAEKLEELKIIEGFPIGKDEDILALSEPPYFTACPNPYIKDFIEEHGTPYDEETDDYHRVAFNGNIVVSKNNKVYNSHAYHTKVPPGAIQNLIKHFTKEKDIIFDGYCGSGMAGVASTGMNRNSILSDLSPFATQITYNYNRYTDKEQIKKDFNEIINKLKEEYGYFFETNYNGYKAEIINVVWSDVNICKLCNNEFLYSDGKKESNYFCPNCKAELRNSDYRKVMFSTFDDILGKEIRIAKQMPQKNRMTMI